MAAQRAGSEQPDSPVAISNGNPVTWTTKEVIFLVKDLGFPIVVALYLLFRLDGQISTLIAVIHDVSSGQQQIAIEIQRQGGVH